MKNFDGATLAESAVSARKWMIIGMIAVGVALSGCRVDGLEESAFVEPSDSQAAPQDIPPPPDSETSVNTGMADSGSTGNDFTDTEVTNNVLTEGGETGTGATDAGATDTGLIDTGLVDTGLSDSALVDADLSETAASSDTGNIPADAAVGDNQTQPPVTGILALSWRAPSEREDGTALPLSELSGYRIYYGPIENPTANQVAVDDASTMSYRLEGVAPGTYQVAVSAVDLDGLESTLSNSMSKTIQ